MSYTSLLLTRRWKDRRSVMQKRSPISYSAITSFHCTRGLWDRHYCMLGISGQTARINRFMKLVHLSLLT